MAKTFNLSQLDIEFKSSDDYAIREISVAVIDENPLNNEIYDFNEDDYKKLVDDIASVGLIQPICVRRNPILSDRYIVISGHRRLKACKQLGYHKVPCIVKRVDTDADVIKADIMLLTSNIAVRSRSITERGREASYLKELIRKLKEQGGEEYKGKTDDIVAQLMDVAPSYVRRLVRIDKASDEVKELVDKEALSLKEALALEEMPAQNRKAVIQKLKNAKSAHEIKEAKVAIENSQKASNIISDMDKQYTAFKKNILKLRPEDAEEICNKVIKVLKNLGGN